MAKATREDVLEYLESANMLEVSELIKDIEDKFGVSSAAPVAMAAPVAGAADGAAAETKDEFDIELTAVGDKKINVIKVVRTIKRMDIPSTPNLNFIKSFIQFFSSTNWNSAEFKSKECQRNKERIKVAILANKEM